MSYAQLTKIPRESTRPNSQIDSRTGIAPTAPVANDADGFHYTECVAGPALADDKVESLVSGELRPHIFLRRTSRAIDPHLTWLAEHAAHSPAESRSANARIKTLIVDNDALGRRKLSTLLELETDFEVVGECGDSESAVRAIAAVSPDLIFIDARMAAATATQNPEPGNACQPGFVFVNPPDLFTSSWLGVQALDYLPTPFCLDRFLTTLARARRWVTGQFHDAARARQESAFELDRIIIKCGARLIFVHLQELEFIRAAANYVQLQVAGETFQVREKIGVMEAQLPAKRFVRIHRSYVVNLSAIRELYPIGGGEYMIALQSGRQLPVGSSYPPLLREALANAALQRFGWR